MDCHRRLRLGSGLAVLAAVLSGGSATSGAGQAGFQLTFESRPQVEALRCPSQETPSSTRAAAPNERIPAADELDTTPIDAGRPMPSPSLAQDVRRGFLLPSPGGEPLRVGVWGDSHVAAGFITDEIAKLAEARGLSVATRMLPASVGRPGVRLPVRRVCKSGGWEFQPAYRAPTTQPVGPGLSTLRSANAGDYLWLDLRHRAERTVRGVRIQYLPTRAASAIGIRVDDGAEARIELAGRGPGPVAPGQLDVRASLSISTLKLRVIRGEVVLHGIALDYVSRHDVTIDVFGLPSATVNGWSNADAAFLRRSIDPGGYDAIILEYGTNEGAVGRFDASKYAAMLTSSLRNVREVFPDAACLMMGPTDRGVRIPQGPRRGPADLLQYSRIHQQITRIQGDVGKRFGCAVWDWQRAMGGTGSIYSWARATPALAAPDLIHLTLAGYRRTAAALAQSLGWLEPPPAIR